MKAGRLPDHLAHMLEAATLACGYLQGTDRETFAQEHAHIPWRAMKGMRNRIAHGYFDINLDVVWETVQTALPALQEQLQALHPPRG